MKQLRTFLIQFFLLLFGVSVLIYIFTALLPGTAQEILAGMEGDIRNGISSSLSLLEHIRAFFGWVWGLIRLDMGSSYFTGEPILQMILRHWRITVLLSMLSWASALMLALAIVERLLHAQRKKLFRGVYTVVEFCLLSFTPLTMSLAILLAITFFRIPLPIFSISDSPLQNLLRYLPAYMTLLLLQIPIYVRSLHSSVSMLQKQPYVAFSYSLGYSKQQVWRQVLLPNSLLYTITLSSVQLSILLGGTILVEHSFSIPGLGTLLVQAVYSRDIVLVRGIVFFYALLVGTLHVLLKLLHVQFFGLEERYDRV